MHTQINRNLHSIRFPLVDISHDGPAEREDFIRTAASAYVLALHEALVESAVLPVYLQPQGTTKFPARTHEPARWECIRCLSDDF